MVKSKKTTQRYNTKREDVKPSRKTIDRRVPEKLIGVPKSRRVSLRLQCKLEASPLPAKENPRKNQTRASTRHRRENVNDTAKNTRLSLKRLKNVSQTNQKKLVGLQLRAIPKAPPSLDPKCLERPSRKSKRSSESFFSLYPQTRGKQKTGKITKKISKSTKIKEPIKPVSNSGSKTQKNAVPLRRSKRILIIQQNEIGKSSLDGSSEVSTPVLEACGKQSRVPSKTSRKTTIRSPKNSSVPLIRFKKNSLPLQIKVAKSSDKHTVRAPSSQHQKSRVKSKDKCKARKETANKMVTKVTRETPRKNSSCLGRSLKTRDKIVKKSTINEGLGASPTLRSKTQTKQTLKSGDNSLSKAPRKTLIKTSRNTTIPMTQSKKDSTTSQSKLKSNPKECLKTEFVDREMRSKRSRNSSIKSLPVTSENLKRSQSVKRQKKVAKLVKVSEGMTKKLKNRPKNLKTLTNIKSMPDPIGTFLNTSTPTTSNLDLNTAETSNALDQMFKTPTIIPSLMSNEKAKAQMKRRTSIRINSLKSVIVERNNPIQKDNSPIQRAKETLHVSTVPKMLTCREKEFKEIYNFIESKILDGTGGCMYVSGPPGTGKTSTIDNVIKLLNLQVEEQKLPEFDFIEINGMRLTDPRLAYVHIYQQLTSESVSWQQAHSFLGNLFENPASRQKTAVLLVDEFEVLKSHRQDVLYNILDWATKRTARLFVIAIANIINPERLLAAGVTSRLGSTRIIFQPYKSNELQEIVQARLTGIKIFETDALQLIARKVASISGDCRRALDICRRAVEIGERDCAGQEVMVSMSHVQKAFNEMITSPKVTGIKGSSKYEKLFLQAVAAEVARTGVDETVLLQVYRQFETICALNGVNVPEPGTALRISCRLGSSGLLICEHSSASIHQKIMLNVTQDELSYAFDVST